MKAQDQIPLLIERDGVSVRIYGTQTRGYATHRGCARAEALATVGSVDRMREACCECAERHPVRLPVELVPEVVAEPIAQREKDGMKASNGSGGDEVAETGGRPGADGARIQRETPCRRPGNGLEADPLDPKPTCA